MNTPTKAVEATVPAQNVEKNAGKTDNKGGAPENKAEVINPLPTGSTK
jgi:hypothetical protein